MNEKFIIFIWTKPLNVDDRLIPIQSCTIGTYNERNEANGGDEIQSHKVWQEQPEMSVGDLLTQ